MKKEVKKTPRVAMKAPRTLDTLYPTKVAVIRMGPGVTWPSAMPSKNSFVLSHLI